MKNYISSKTLLSLISFALLSCGCAEKKHFAEPGRYLQADFTCRLEDGSLVDTTLAGTAGDTTVKKSVIFELRDTYRPVKFKVAENPQVLQSLPFDPLEQKIGVAIARRITEIPLNTTHKLELHDEVIENFPPGDRYLEMARKYPMPRERLMPMDEYVLYYGEDAPVIGATVGEESDFPGIVRAISDDGVTVFFSAVEGARMNTATGPATVHQEDDQFLISMDVQPGNLIQRIGGLPGRVSEINDETYKVDFAHTFAGETLFCDVTAQDHDPAKAKNIAEVTWLEDYESALNLSKELDKPVILVLYADWCKYCHKFFNQLQSDPNLATYHDSFVWLKINSDKIPEFADKFGQQTYPMTVFLDADGGELEKFSGLQHITTLVYTLDKILTEKEQS